MDHFSQKNIDYLYKMHYYTEKKEGQVKFEKPLETLETVQKVYDEDTKSRSKFTKGKRQKQKIGRNDPCPCGSGKKYKKCCLRIEDSD